MADKFQLKAILSAVDKMTPTLKGIAKSVRIVHKSFRDIGNAGGELMRKIGVPAFLSFSAVSYGAIRATKAALDYAGSIQDASERTGSTAQEFQSLSNMMGLVGGTAEDAEMAMTKFNKGIAEAASGGDKNFSGLMKKLHIPLKNAQGEIISLTDVLPQLAKGFSRNANPALQTRMAMELFGKSGTKLIPIMNGLNDGSISLAAAMKAVVSNDEISRLDDVGDSVAMLGTKVKTTWTSAIAKMAPAIEPIIKSLGEWLDKNQELIKSGIVEILTDIAGALKEVDWKSIFKDIRETITDIKDFIKAVGGVKTIIVGMGLAWIAGPIAAIGSIIGAIWRLRLAFFALGTSATASSAAVAGSFGASASAGMISNLGMLAKSAGLLGAAAMVGWTIGTAISDHLLSDEFKERLGRGISRILSSFGNETATQALINEGQLPKDYLEKQKNQKLTRYGYVQNTPATNSNGITKNTNSLIQTNQQKVNGQITVDFKNAPEGTRVNVAKPSQNGVALNADVGYRKQVFAL